jgi:Zn-dependent protease
MSGGATGQLAPVCPQCGTHVAPALLACPSCARLVHADELKRLAAAAERAAQAGEVSTALAAWRQTLDLLPRDSTQHQVVSARVLDLSRTLDGQNGAAATPAARKQRSRLGKSAAGLGALGALLAKFKFAILFLLTKAKLLLLGFTKAGTLLTMLLSMGVYWTIWGWQFAVGVVLSIYVHEMGHVQALQRYGIKATAPMFIPGVGAFVRLKQYPADRREDARVGLAGPIWGLAAALVAYAVYHATGSGLWGAVARFGAWVNLFNLTPVWQLDGGRGFRALTRLQRWIAVAVIAATWFLTGEGLLALLGVAAVANAGFTAPADEPDRTALVQYCFLVVVLGAMAQVAVPAIPR